MVLFKCVKIVSVLIFMEDGIMHKGGNKLCPMIVALALAIVWSLSIASLAWLAACCGYGKPVVALIGSVYIGYSATFLGGVIGLVWGFADMFIGVWLVFWVYRLLCRMASKCCSPKAGCCDDKETVGDDKESCCDDKQTAGDDNESCCDDEESCCKPKNSDSAA